MPNTTLNAPEEKTSSRSASRLFARLQIMSWSSLRTWSGKGVLALLDQGLISGSNFLIAILLARQLLPHTYGAYALAFEVFLLLSVLYGALVLEPMSVFGSSVYRKSSRKYFGVLFRIHAVIGLGILVIMGASAWMVHEFAAGRGLSNALVGVAIASPCVLMFWIVRRAFYVEVAPKQAVVGALVYFAVVIGGLLIVYRAKLLSPMAAFLLMAAGAVATTPMMMIKLRPYLQSVQAGPSVREVIRRHWEYGRWAVSGSVATWLSNAIYYPLLGGFHGLADTGSLKALMNFTSPISQVFAALSLLSLPYAARVHHGGKPSAMYRLVWKLTAIYALGTLLYWIVIIGFEGPIVRHLYAGKYMAVASLVPWVALGSLLRISSTAQAIVLRAMHSPNLVFVAYAASCLVALFVGIPCTWAFGLRGAIFTLIFSNGAALLIALIIVRRKSSFARGLEHPQTWASETSAPL